ncbi:MAG: hypothetical protein IJA26_00480 [Clostridia bacterium]|nr:hypothetical protein [Clostridia bacterium]
MKRESLVLMEQLIMILIFALATALCLRLFVRADAISVENTRQDNAVLMAQNAAELLKSGADAGDIPGGGEYSLDIRMEESGVPGLAQAEIKVYHIEEIEPLYTLTVGWQEGLE